MGLFDVHAHLTHSRMVDDEKAVLQRARDAGLTTIISNGLNQADNQAVLELSRRSGIVRPAFGLYPVDAVWPELVEAGLAAEYPRDLGEVDVAATLEWVAAHAHEAIAVGEIGLDGHWVPEPFWDRQEEVFRSFVELALEVDKPIIIHTRKRERRTFEVLKEMGAQRVNWHCFGSRVKLARQIARETEHTFSIPANVGRSQSFTRMLEVLPRERILLETDCPYLGPEPGVRNEPSNVVHTIARAAELWGESEESVLDQLEDNFERMYGVRP